MPIPTASFTDVHGVVYTEAVLKIKTATVNRNSSESIELQGVSYTDNSHNHTDTSYQVCYWPDQELCDAGKLPLIFKDNSGNEHFNFNRQDGGEYDGLDVLAATEKHFQDHILSLFINS